MDLQVYPHLRERLAVRLGRQSSAIVRLEDIKTVISLSGSSWLFLQAMTGARSVAEIAADIAAEHDLDPVMIQNDFIELLDDLQTKGVVRLSPDPVDDDRPCLHVVADDIRASVHMDITHKCNEVCVHCLVPRDHVTASIEDIKDVVDQAAALGFVSLSFSGGEPTLHPQFWELLEYCRALGFFFTIFTNAIRLSDEELQRLAALEPEQVRLSIYSMDPAVHDRITTIDGSFAKTKAAVLRLHELGARLYINTPVMTHNAASYLEVAAFTDALQIEGNLDPTIQPLRDRSNTYQELQLTYEQAKEVTAAQQTADVLVVNVVPGQPVCNAGDDPSIDASLNLYPCPGLRKSLGNLREHRLAELLIDNPELERVSTLSLEDLPECQRCPVRDGCYRCHGHGYQDFLDVTACGKSDKRQAKIRRELMIERGTIND